MKKLIYTYIVTFVCLLGGLISCKETTDLELPYLFRPVNFNVELNKTVASISWSAVDSASSYTLQIGTDSLFATSLIDTTVNSLSFTQELAGETKFFARVRANAIDTLKNSKFNSKLSFTTPKENLFTGFGTSINTGTLYSAYMTDANVLTVKWTPGANVTHLILTSADGVGKDSVGVSNDEKAAGMKVVSSLSNANWKVKIYNNEILRGTTYGVVEGDVVVRAGGNLQAALTAATPGQVILLEGNATYTIGTGAMTLNANIKLRGLSPIARPVVSMTSGATSGANMFVFGISSINYIKFENLDITGYCENNTALTKVAYMFNNGTTANVANLSFTNCKIRNFGNTPFRLKNAVAQVIDTLLLNGCVVNDIGFTSTYAIVNSNTNDLFNNIIFANSTFYNFKGSLISRTTQTIKSVSISNCNINQATQDGAAARYMFDLNNAAFSGTFSVKNTIFGQSGSTVGANGFRGLVTPTFSGCYYTSDYVDDPIPAGVTNTSIKSKMGSYSGASTALWTDPVNGDFKLKDTSFAGKGVAGDLRW
ncbi:MAG: hypothetical protein RIS29_3126 [Bacteroidota bacterium]|jgi:hypothetical protein